MTNFEKVKIFMKKFGQEVKNSSSLSSEKINNLRISLIGEELDETIFWFFASRAAHREVLVRERQIGVHEGR